MMRRATSLIVPALLLAVAGCRDNPEPAPPENGVILPPVENESAPAEDMNAANGTANDSSEALPTIAGDTVYICTPSMTVSTRFAAAMATSEEGAGDDDLIVMVNGSAYRMTLVRSASGTKYATEKGRAPGKSLIWWTKGKEAMLLEGKDEAQVATCTEK